jgi:hypothetical protein
MNDDIVELTEAERAAMISLPRTSTPPAHIEDSLVRTLRREGFFRSPVRTRLWVQLAAAVLLLALGAATGAYVAQRNSLETMLARRDLSSSERILLLQRAGSAYVTAAQSYGQAASAIDSVAVEVASQTLLGAARAVARSSLDAGLSARLSSILEPPPALQPPHVRQIIWY